MDIFLCRQVIEGMDVLKQLEEQETYNERPKKECVVEDCGEFEVEKLWKWCSGHVKLTAPSMF